MPDDIGLEEEEEEQLAEETGGGAGFLSKFKGSLGKILGFSLIAILIILVSVGISYLVSSHVNKSNIREIGGKIYIPPPPPYETVDMGEFTMNIKGDDGEPHFIRVKIVLAYGERELSLAAEISKRRPQIQNLINLILSEKTKAELDTPEGKRNLQIEIKERINQMLQNGKIKDVYFTSVTVM